MQPAKIEIYMLHLSEMMNRTKMTCIIVNMDERKKGRIIPRLTLLIQSMKNTCSRLPEVYTCHLGTFTRPK